MSNRKVSLLRNAVTIVIVVLVLMFTLAEIGLNIGPLLASAGVLGLAIRFGAQSVVQDIIAGVFIPFENAMNISDVVSVNGTTGTAEKLSIRSVGQRQVNITVRPMPFSSVDLAANFSRDFPYFVSDMRVACRENMNDVREVMPRDFDRLNDDPKQGDFVMDDLERYGMRLYPHAWHIHRIKMHLNEVRALSGAKGLKCLVQLL